jgi:hypothetical protein
MIKEKLIELILFWLEALQSPTRCLGIILLVIGVLFHQDISLIIQIIAPKVDANTINIVVSALTGVMIGRKQ